MAFKINEIFKSIALSGAYVRIQDVAQLREQDRVVVRYAVWASEAAAAIPAVSREALTNAEQEYAGFLAGVSPNHPQYEAGLRLVTSNLADEKQRYRAARQPVEEALYDGAEEFPYESDVTVAKGYLLMKTRSKFADAIDA